MCWQTAEQQFNPALAIASAVSHYNMKTLVITLLMFIETFVFGQDYHNYDTYDTVKIIRARHLPDYKISYLTDNCEFQFSKTLSIKTIDKFIKEIASDKSSLYIYEIGLERINNYKIVRNYLINQDSVKLNKPSLTDTIINTLQLTSSLFGDFLPEMLDSGMFKLFIDGKEQAIITKIDGSRDSNNFYEALIFYIAENGKEVWSFVYDFIESYPADLPLKSFEPEEMPEPEKKPNN